MTDKLRLEWRDAKDLTDNPANWRRHPSSQARALQDIISEVGWAGALLYNEQTGRLIDGHLRKKVSKGKVPVLIGSWSEADERKILATLDPIANMAQADGDALIALLRQVETGSQAVKDLLEALANGENLPLLEPKGGLIPDDEIPEASKPICKTGDLWQLGEHRLLCGDATKKEDVERLMGGEKADMVFTDPPYGIGYEYQTYDDNDNHKNAQLVADVFGLFSCGKVWTCGLNNLARDINRFGKTYIAVWYKKFAQAGSGLGGASTWEPILILSPTMAQLDNNVIEVMTDRELGLREKHSCPKPARLFEELVKSLSRVMDIVADPFGGSGTTLIACEKLNRKCYMMEIEPYYCDVIIERWQKFTGKVAVKLG